MSMHACAHQTGANAHQNSRRYLTNGWRCAMVGRCFGVFWAWYLLTGRCPCGIGAVGDALPPLMTAELKALGSI